MRASFLISALILATLAPLRAQQPTAAPRLAGAPGEVNGKLVEAGSGRALTSGSITVRR